MTRYSVDSETREGETLLVLRDGDGPGRAQLWPAWGNNCLAARLAAPDGGAVEALLAPDSLDQVRQQPSWWGIPLLFPWPGRIPGGEYAFAGQRYRLPVQDMNGNAGHGFVKTRPFRVVATAATEEYAEVRCAISSADHPETLEGYPFPYLLATTYRLGAEGLTLDVAVENSGSGPLPFGFGAHPYFRIPIAAPGRREDCLVTVPAARRWNLPRIGALGPHFAPSGWRGSEIAIGPAGDTNRRQG
ncbi:MAG: aldose 1-epimerase, partial [Chloroflexota bacterium]|nr:aldose 1-epimerase [Chloroflexota bacterium]